MTKFKLTWTMEVDDDELLEMVNDFQDAEEGEEITTLEGITEETLIEVLDYNDYIEVEMDEYLDRAEVLVELLPNEEV